MANTALLAPELFVDHKSQAHPFSSSLVNHKAHNSLSDNILQELLLLFVSALPKVLELAKGESLDQEVDSVFIVQEGDALSADPIDQLVSTEST